MTYPRNLTRAQIEALSLTEMEARLPRARERMLTLQMQLELQDRSHGDGRPMSDVEFEAWREKCLMAHRHQVIEYRILKEQLHQRRMESPDGPVSLLKAALGILREVEDLEAEDIAVCQRIEKWLTERPTKQSEAQRQPRIQGREA